MAKIWREKKHTEKTKAKAKKTHTKIIIKKKLNEYNDITGFRHLCTLSYYKSQLIFLNMWLTSCCYGNSVASAG